MGILKGKPIRIDRGRAARTALLALLAAGPSCYTPPDQGSGNSTAVNDNMTSGTVSNKLPTLDMVGMEMKYAIPGVGGGSAVPVCGDYDVNRFFDEHNSSGEPVDFYRPPSGGVYPPVRMVLGFWVVPAGAANALPTADNWYPIAYSELSMDGRVANAWNIIGKACDRRPVNRLVNFAIEEVHDQSQAGFYVSASGGTNEQYSVYMATQSCLTYRGDTVLTGQSPGALDIVASMRKNSPTGIYKKIDSDVEANFSNDRFVLSYAVPTQPDDFTGALTIDLRNSGAPTNVVNVSGDLMNLSGSVMGMSDPPPLPNNPDGTPQLYTPTTYRAAVNSQYAALKGQLNTISTQLDTVAKCSQVSAVGGPDKYWFDPFNTEFICKMLKTDPGSPSNAFKNEFDSLFDSHNSGELSNRKAKLAKRLRKAAFMRQVYAHLQGQTQYKRPTARCFEPAKKFYQTLLGSYVIDFYNEGPALKVRPMPPTQHPEPYFAIDDYRHYDGSIGGRLSGDYKAIFGMNRSGDNITPYGAYVVTKGSTTNPAPGGSILAAVLDFSFRIRAFDCPGGSGGSNRPTGTGGGGPGDPPPGNGPGSSGGFYTGNQACTNPYTDWGIVIKYYNCSVDPFQQLLSEIRRKT